MITMAVEEHGPGVAAEPIRRRTWKPTVGGILILIPGILGLLASLLLLLNAGDISRNLPQEFNTPVSPGMVVAAALLALALSLVVLAGGWSALRRRSWGLALAGGILGMVLSGITLLLILPLIGMVLVALSRREFIRRPEYVAERRLTGA